MNMNLKCFSRWKQGKQLYLMNDSVETSDMHCCAANDMYIAMIAIS